MTSSCPECHVKHPNQTCDQYQRMNNAVIRRDAERDRRRAEHPGPLRRWLRRRGAR